MQVWVAQGTRSRWAGRALVAAALIAPFAPRAARADTAAVTIATRPLILLVIPEGEAAEARERAAGTIAAHVRQLAVELSVVHEPRSPESHRAPGEPGILARAKELAAERHARGVLWVGAGSGDLSLHLYAPDDDRLFARRVPVVRGQTAAAIESLALIAQSASAELLEGKVAAMAPVASRGPADPPAATPPEPLAALAPGAATVAGATGPIAATAPLPAMTPLVPVDDGGAAADPDHARPAERPLTPEGPDYVSRRSTSGSIALAAGYVGNTGTRGVAWQSAFALEAGWHPSVHGTLGVGYEIALPDTAAPGSGPGMESALSARHPLFFFGSYRLLLSPRWDLDVGGRTVIDFVTHASVRGFTATTPTEVRGSVGPNADLGFRILPPLRLGLLLGMDVVLNPPAGTPMRPSELSDRLRFVSALGLQLDLEPAGRDPPKVPRNTASR